MTDIDINEEIKKRINSIDELETKINTTKQEIRPLIHELIDELVTIEGWDVLIDHENPTVEEYYKEYTDKAKYLKDCYYQWTDYNTIKFIIPFLEKFVLEINLDKSLEEQISEALKNVS